MPAVNMHPRRLFHLLILLSAAAAALAAPACTDGESDEEKPAVTSTAESPQDKAARLAARSQLEAARAAQESYFSQHQEYAGSFEELKEESPRLNNAIEVAYGNEEGFEISITASDSARTVYLLRKSGSGIERRDGSGNSW